MEVSEREKRKKRQSNYLGKKKKKPAENFPKLEKGAHPGPGSKEGHKQDQPKKVHIKTYYIFKNLKINREY